MFLEKASSHKAWFLQLVANSLNIKILPNLLVALDCSFTLFPSHAILKSSYLKNNFDSDGKVILVFDKGLVLKIGCFTSKVVSRLTSDGRSVPIQVVAILNRNKYQISAL